MVCSDTSQAMKNIEAPAKVILFDIESTSLKADFGYCLCFGYKELGAPSTTVLAITDFKQHHKEPTNDKALMKLAHEVLTDADIIVSFYGKEFDRKFLNTRMLMAGLPPLPPLSHEHVDLYFTARGNLALHSNRLASVAAALGCPFEKTSLDGPTWIKASSGNKAAIEYIKEHCARDVEVLEYCYKKLRPYVRQHPFVGLRGNCRVCGSENSQKRGFTVTKTGGRQHRVQCQDCGAWRQEK